MGMGKQVVDASKAKIAMLENRLSGTLKPVSPRREFVHGLGNRIQTGKQANFVDRLPGWHYLAVLIAGLVSLAVLLAVVTRALLGLSRKRSPGETP